jgi:hypothetical protein
MKEKLKCLSEKTATELYDNVAKNIGRYKNGNFEDLATEYGWSVELSVNADLESLKDLDGNDGKESEVKNALLVWRALKELTPSLACENRIWARMTHLEGLKYSRQRWFLKAKTPEAQISSVQEHFFADGRTKWRDDNALSRLWWVAFIAAQAFPHDQKTALDLILSKADFRQAFVERPGITSRPRLASGILRAMMNDNWVTKKEINYRLFIKRVNKFGGGLLFETWKDSDIDQFVLQCAVQARSDVKQPA